MQRRERKECHKTYNFMTSDSILRFGDDILNIEERVCVQYCSYLSPPAALIYIYRRVFYCIIALCISIACEYLT